MFKGLGQIASFMKHAQEIQGRMKEMQESLKRVKVEGTAGGGSADAGGAPAEGTGDPAPERAAVDVAALRNPPRTPVP